MKLNHFTIVFLLFAVPFCFIFDRSLSLELRAAEETAFVDEALEDACTRAAAALAECSFPDMSCGYIADVFITELAAGLGLYGEPDFAVYLRKYVPVILTVTDSSVNALCFDGTEEFLRSEPRYLNDDVTATVERMLEECSLEANSRARRSGIAYTFNIGAADSSEWFRTVTGPCVLALFQDYPIGSGSFRYNRFAAAGAQLYEAEAIYVERGPEGATYHYSGCPVYDCSGGETYFCAEDAARAGAYACDVCSRGYGIHRHH